MTQVLSRVSIARKSERAYFHPANPSARPPMWGSSEDKINTPKSHVTSNRHSRRDVDTQVDELTIVNAEDASQLKDLLGTKTQQLSQLLRRPFAYIGFIKSGSCNTLESNLSVLEFSKHLNGNLHQFFSDLILSGQKTQGHILPLIVFTKEGEINSQLEAHLSNYLQFELSEKIIWLIFDRLQTFLKSGGKIANNFPGKIVSDRRGIVVESISNNH
jgi:hypothetical protein